MILEEHTVEDDRIEVLADGALQIREATVILRDGAIDPSYPKKYHRYVLTPGADLIGKSQRIVAVARSVWSDDVVAAWQAACAAGQ
jgi:hypothetical protein